MTSILTGFVLGLLAAVIIRLWQSRIDEHAQSYNEIRSAILRAAKISTGYWLKNQRVGDPEAEARLIGLFHLINGLTVALAKASGDSPKAHSERLTKFNHLATGGPDYGNEQREPNTARARLVQHEAAELILYFRDYRRSQLSMAASLRIGFLGSRSARRN